MQQDPKEQPGNNPGQGGRTNPDNPASPDRQPAPEPLQPERNPETTPDGEPSRRPDDDSIDDPDQRRNQGVEEPESGRSPTGSERV